jgi:putative mRNA 3-end processing factor
VSSSPRGGALVKLAIEVRPEGLYLPALDLHLDPQRSVSRAFVSHAHGDHAAADLSGVGTLLSSPETRVLVEARRSTRPSVTRTIGWDESIELPIDRAHGGGTARVSIAPAGHILGAAQLVIDHPGGRFVYTGDYQSGASPTHATGAPVPCDELVIESTFGLPIFRFPPREQTTQRIVDWCRAHLAAGATPVLLGYALGKSQALVHACLAAELPVVAHGAVHRMCAAYESLGVPMGVADGRLIPYAMHVEQERKSRKKADREAAVIVSPPQTRGQPMIRKRTDARIAYVSGWALIDAAIEQRRADAGFALSDHADYDDLVATARATGARRIYVTHGDDVEVFARLVTHETGIETIALAAPPIDAHEEQA